MSSHIHTPIESVMTEFMAKSVQDRLWAAEILNKVAEAGQAGCWPNDVTCETLGRALYRLVMNAPDGSSPRDNLMVVIAGMLHGLEESNAEAANLLLRRA